MNALPLDPPADIRAQLDGGQSGPREFVRGRNGSDVVIGDAKWQSAVNC